MPTEGKGIGCDHKTQTNSESPGGAVIESTNNITSTEPLSHANIQQLGNSPPTWLVLRSGDRHSDRGTITSGLDVLAQENTEGSRPIPGSGTGGAYSASTVAPSDGHQLAAKLNPSNRGLSRANDSASIDGAPWKESRPIYHSYLSVQNARNANNGEALYRELASSTESSPLSSVPKDIPQDDFHDVESHPNVTQVDSPALDYSASETLTASSPKFLSLVSIGGGDVSERENATIPGHGSNMILKADQDHSETATIGSDASLDLHTEGLRDPLTDTHPQHQTEGKHLFTPVSNFTGQMILNRHKQSHRRGAQDNSDVPDNQTPLNPSSPELAEADSLNQNSPRNVQEFRSASRHFLDDMTYQIRNMLENFVPRHVDTPPSNRSPQYFNYDNGNIQKTTSLPSPHHMESQLAQQFKFQTANPHHDLAQQSQEDQETPFRTKLTTVNFQPTPDYKYDVNKEQTFLQKDLRRDFTAKTRPKSGPSKLAPRSTDTSSTKRRYGPSVHKGIIRSKSTLHHMVEP